MRQALQVLKNLQHRGACGCEVNTGDGAGILIQMPDTFLRKGRARSAAARRRIRRRPGLPAARGRRPRHRSSSSSPRSSPKKASADRLARRADRRQPGRPERRRRRAGLQADFHRAESGSGGSGLTGQADAARLRAQALRHPQADRARRSTPPSHRRRVDKKLFYIVSLSCNTLIYKGMLTASQIETMFPDLTDPDVESALALVHQRFSTNTFPSWPLAHPYRYIAHNGEINTLRGNINWMRAREGLLQSDLFGDDLKKILPVIREGGSDTATFDNVLEFLVMTGRSLPHAILMMIPEPWQNHESMSPELKAFYEYHSSLMEPWDGPASIAFTDGTVIGAVLDRNGLRPSRYYVTKDDLVVMASEVGVLDIPPEDIVLKERLHPGRIFLVDTARGRIVSDEEIKRELAAAHPYKRVAVAPDRHRRSRSGAVSAAAEPRDGHAAAAAVRLHARGSAAPARADGDDRAKKRSARWAPTRRWRRCRIGRGCSTTTSSSCSRRSPIRRSTRSARSS